MSDLELSRILRKMVFESGKTVHELAKDTGIGHSTIWAWLHGRHGATVHALDQILAELGYELAIVRKEH